MKRKPAQGDGGAMSLAVDVLLWLSADENRLMGFMNLSGATPEAIRAGLRDPALLGAVLDHVMADETALLACAEALAVKPDTIAAAWRRLQPPDFDPGL